MHINNDKKNINREDTQLNSNSGVSFEGNINVFSIRVSKSSIK